MKQKNNNLAIGGFVVGALIILFLLMLVFSGGNYFTDKERVILYFDGSVQGLQIGAPIKLKGVEIGEVVNIEVTFLAEDIAVLNIVTGEIVLKYINQIGQQPSEDIIDLVIDKGLRAQLNYQSFLTGLLYVELDFYPDTDVRLLNLQNQYRELPTIDTDFESLFKQIAQVDIAAVSENLSSVLKSLNSILASEKLETAINDFSEASRAVENLANELDASTELFDKLLIESSQTVPHLSNEITLTLTDLRKTLKEIDSTMSTVGDSMSEDSVFVNQITQSAQEVRRAAIAVKSLSETLEQQPEALLRGKQGG